jgi:hypothetical protein
MKTSRQGRVSISRDKLVIDATSGAHTGSVRLHLCAFFIEHLCACHRHGRFNLSGGQVILLHGLGTVLNTQQDNGPVDIGRQISAACPWLKVILPQGTRTRSMECSCLGVDIRCIGVFELTTGMHFNYALGSCSYSHHQAWPYEYGRVV